MKMDVILNKIKTNQWTELLDDVKDISPSNALEVLRWISATVFYLTDVPDDIVPVVIASSDIILKDNGFQPDKYLKYLYHIVKSCIKPLQKELTPPDRRTKKMNLISLYKKVTPLCAKTTYSQESQNIFGLLLKDAWSFFKLPVQDDLNVNLELVKHALLFCIPKENNLSLLQKYCINTVNSYNLQAKSYKQPEKRTKENLVSFYCYILSNVLKSLGNNYKIVESSEAMFILDIFTPCVTHHTFEHCSYFLKLLKQCCNDDVYSAMYSGIKLIQAVSDVKLKNKDPSDVSKAVSFLLQYKKTFEKNITCQVIVALCLVNCFGIMNGEFEESKKMKVVYLFLNDQMFDYMIEKVPLLDKPSYILCLYNFLKCLSCEIKRVNAERSDLTSTFKSSEAENDAVFRKAKDFCSMAYECIKKNVAITKGNASHYKDFGALCGNVGILCYSKSKFSLSLDCILVSIGLLESCIDLDPENRESLLSSISRKYDVAYECCRLDGNLIIEYSDLSCNEIKLHLKLGTLFEKAENSESRKIDEIIEHWVRVKRESAKCEVPPFTPSATLYELMKSKEEGIKYPSSAITIEYNAYQESSLDFTTEQIECAKILHSVGRQLCEPSDKKLIAIESAVMLSKTLLIANTSCEPHWGTVKELKESLQEGSVEKTVEVTVLSLLTAAHSAAKTVKRLTVNELLVEVHYLLYTVTMRDYTKMQKDKEGKGLVSSLTTSATDQGEEVPVDDSCDFRSNLSLLLSNKELNRAKSHLTQALHYLRLTKVEDISHPQCVCKVLYSLSAALKLEDKLIEALECSDMMAKVSSYHCLPKYNAQAYMDMLWLCPELCPVSFVTHLAELVKKKALCSDNKLQLHSKVVTSFFCLHKGMYSHGWQLLDSLLSHDIFSEKTVRSTELQCLIHYVASLYCMLPPANRPSHHLVGTQHSNPIAISQLAAREAIALTGVEVQDLHWCSHSNYLLLCTTLWLGRLALFTGQPRIARAYLKSPMKIAHQMGLPSRCAAIISLLAEVDMMCDQVNDCRTKVDSLRVIFYPTSCQLNYDMLDEENISTVAKASKQQTKKDPFRKQVERCPSNAVESIRHEKLEEEEVIQDGLKNLKSHHYINIHSQLKKLNGVKSKLESLPSERSAAPSSPSFGHREAKTLLPLWEPQKLPDSSISGYLLPFSSVYLTLGFLLTEVHLYEERLDSAHKIIQTTESQVASVKESIVSYAERIDVLLSNSVIPCHTSASCLIGDVKVTDCDLPDAATARQIFTSNLLLPVWSKLQQSKCQAQCSSGYFKIAKTDTSEAIKRILHFPPQSVQLHYQLLLPLTLQSVKIKKYEDDAVVPHVEMDCLSVTADSPSGAALLSTPSQSPNKLHPPSKPPPIRQSPSRRLNNLRKDLTGMFKNTSEPRPNFEWSSSTSNTSPNDSTECLSSQLARLTIEKESSGKKSYGVTMKKDVPVVVLTNEEPSPKNKKKTTASKKTAAVKNTRQRSKKECEKENRSHSSSPEIITKRVTRRRAAAN